MPKHLVLSDIRNRAGKFAAAWRDAEGHEPGEAQTFVRDLLAVFGTTKSTAAVYERPLNAPQPAHKSSAPTVKHRIMSQITLVVNGAGMASIQGCDIELRKGRPYLYPPEAAHRFQAFEAGLELRHLHWPVESLKFNRVVLAE